MLIKPKNCRVKKHLPCSGNFVFQLLNVDKKLPIILFRFLLQKFYLITQLDNNYLFYFLIKNLNEFFIKVCNIIKKPEDKVCRKVQKRRFSFISTLQTNHANKKTRIHSKLITHDSKLGLRSRPLEFINCIFASPHSRSRL